MALAHQLIPEASFILISGTMGEELAIESLKLGATDYVLKNRLSRLGPTVRRALAEATERKKRQQFEEALRKSEKQYRELCENANEIIYCHDLTGRFNS